MTYNGSLMRDDNDYPVMGGTSSSDNRTVINSAYNPVTRALLVEVSGSGGGGTGTWYTVTGTINGSNVTFIIPVAVKSDFLLVLNRQPQSQGIDYTYLAGVSTTTITYISAPDSSLSGTPHQSFVIT